jgi:hypothetical protein
MNDLDEQLKTIGFGPHRREPACWRAVRCDRPRFPAAAPPARQELDSSRPLRRWRRLLARDSRPSPYRISRA